MQRNMIVLKDAGRRRTLTDPVNRLIGDPVRLVRPLDILTLADHPEVFHVTGRISAPDIDAAVKLGPDAAFRHICAVYRNDAVRLRNDDLACNIALRQIEGDHVLMERASLLC